MMPAPRLERFLAFMIDNFALRIFAEILLLIGGPHSALAMVGVFACVVVYNVLSVASRWQATPGQYFMRLRVVRHDGSQMTERDALERFLAFMLPFLPMYLSIAPIEVLSMATTWLLLAWFLPILMRDDRSGVHDVICGTIVVKASR